MREEHGLRKNKYPTFRECFERYRDEIVIHKKSKEMENKLIKYILTEGFVNYRVDKVNSSMIAGYRDRAFCCVCNKRHLNKKQQTQNHDP